MRNNTIFILQKLEPYKFRIISTIGMLSPISICVWGLFHLHRLATHYDMQVFCLILLLAYMWGYMSTFTFYLDKDMRKYLK